VGERVWIYEAQRGRAFALPADTWRFPPSTRSAAGERELRDGACLGIAGMTAHRCLFQDGGIQGQTVLVAGGAGAVGEGAIQLAKWGGARVGRDGEPRRAGKGRAPGRRRSRREQKER